MMGNWCARIKQVAVLGLISFLASLSMAQDWPAPDKMMKQYGQYNSILLKEARTIDISLKKGDLQVFSTMQKARMLLSDKCDVYSKDDVSYSSLNELEEISAETHLPGKNNKYSVIKVKDFKTNDILEGDIFYDDRKEKTFLYPSLKKGAVTYLEYRHHITDPHFVNGMFFAASVPILEASLTIRCPSDVEIGFKYFNCEETDFEMTHSSAKGKDIYKWTMRNVPSDKFESNAPSFEYYVPHIVPYIKSITSNGDKTPYLANLNALYKWDSKFLKDVNKEEDPELNNLVDSLTAGADNDVEKIKRIYYWVQDQIKYVAFEQGYSGFVPRQASDICDKRYGDCKDMTSILVAMLRHAGLKAHFTWIGTRGIPYSYHDLPTPGVDNHMIVSVDRPDGVVFLDGTNKHLDYGIPSSFIQGKEALISIDENQYKVEKVPVVPAESNRVDEIIELKISGDRLTGKLSHDSYGYQKLRSCYAFDGIEEKDKLKRLSKYLRMGNNTFKLDSIDDYDVNRRDTPFHLAYSFSIDHYIQQNDDELYINLFLNKMFGKDKVEKDRKHPVEYDFNTMFNIKTILEVPEGYAVSWVPENGSFNGDGFSFNYSFDKGDAQVELNFKLIINRLMLESAQFDQWNEMVKKLSKAYAQSVVLKKR